MTTSKVSPARKRFLSASGLARALDTSTQTVLNRIAMGDLIPDAMNGKTVLIDADRVDDIRSKFQRPQILA